MNAPRVTPQDLTAAIVGVDYQVLKDGRTTICLLTLDNGYTVRGESSCVCPENFDAALGEQYAREDAERKVWPLLGFRLADTLHAHRTAEARKELVANRMPMGAQDAYEALCAVKATRIPIEQPHLFDMIERALGFQSSHPNYRDAVPAVRESGRGGG